MAEWAANLHGGIVAKYIQGNVRTAAAMQDILVHRFSSNRFDLDLASNAPRRLFEKRFHISNFFRIENNAAHIKLLGADDQVKLH